MPMEESDDETSMKEETTSRTCEEPIHQVQQQLKHLRQEIQQLRKYSKKETNIPDQEPQAGTSEEPEHHGSNADPQTSSMDNYKIPTFWKSSPVAWFIQIEAMFRNNRIRSDTKKYDAVIAALDQVAICEITDVLYDPPEDNKYQHLKNIIIKRFTESSERQLQMLLSEIQLGDQKPSQLLRKIKGLAKNKASAIFIYK